MGLDAVVYKNRAALGLGRHSSAALVVPETGETYFDQPHLYRRYPTGHFEAVSFRIGNVSSVFELLQEVNKLIGNDSFIARRVVYSGSHSGDTIDVGELAELAQEVATLSESGVSKSSQLSEFLDQLRALINAARVNNNPIVFV